MKQLGIIIIDLLIIFSSILSCYYFFDIYNLLENYEKNLHAFYRVAPMIVVFYLILMYSFGLYSFTRRKLGDVVYTVFLVSASLVITTMAVCFFFREAALAFPRSVLFLSGAFYCLLLTLWRVNLWRLSRYRHGVKPVTVIGPGASDLATVLRKKYEDIYSVRYIHEENDNSLQDSIHDSEMVFLTAGIEGKARKKILNWADKYESEVYFVPEYHEVSLMTASMEKTDDMPTFHIPVLGLTMEERFVKRAVDLFLGSLALLLMLPIGLIVSFIIKLDGGTVLYAQERLTRDGKIFRVLKFRSMVPDAEKLSGPVFAGENDPRITKVGYWLRATRLDELPQILNILKGDMSVVGPRPERPFFSCQFEAEIPQYVQRLKVKAGLTGLAQVEGKYNTAFEDKLRYDLLYIRNYSLLRDFLIILQTIKILFLKESTEGVESVEPVLISQAEQLEE